MNKIKKASLDKINELYSQYKKSVKEIEAQNFLKEFYLKHTIKELLQTDFLKSINNIQEVKTSQLQVWKDVENPNWQEIVLHIFTEEKPEEFDSYEDWFKYEEIIREKIYDILDDNPDLSDFITVGVEE